MLGEENVLSIFSHEGGQVYGAIREEIGNFHTKLKGLYSELKLIQSMAQILGVSVRNKREILMKLKRDEKICLVRTFLA